MAEEIHLRWMKSLRDEIALRAVDEVRPCGRNEVAAGRQMMWRLRRNDVMLRTNDVAPAAQRILWGELESGQTA